MYLFSHPKQKQKQKQKQTNKQTKQNKNVRAKFYMSLLLDCFFVYEKNQWWSTISTKLTPTSPLMAYDR